MDKVTPQTRGTIWKYDLDQDPIIEVPAGAKLLSVGWNKEKVCPCIWVLADPQVPKIKRRVKLLSTGHEIVGDGWEFAGTVQAFDLVHHVFLEIV